MSPRRPVLDAEAAEEHRIRRALGAVTALRAAMLGLEFRYGRRLEEVQPTHLEGARNLAHYLALRRHDLRDVQADLAALGLSSLSGSESRVLAEVDAVLRALHRLLGAQPPADLRPSGFVGSARGRAHLATHAEALFGRAPEARRVRIMVTLPGDAARDGDLVRDLVRAGTDCLRINCAHDDAACWAAMAEHSRRAQRETSRECRLLMDLAGPKLRTGPLAEGPAVLKWRPHRDATGRVTEPARLWLTARDRTVPPPGRADAVVPIEGSAVLVDRARPGDVVHLRDLRGKRRSLTVRGVQGGGVWVEALETAYVGPGTALRLSRASLGNRALAAGRVGHLPPTTTPLSVRPGDKLVLTARPLPAAPGLRGEDGSTRTPHRISCSLPEVLGDLRAGESIWFDDGKIGGRILEADAEQATVEILHARPEGSKLGADKGINLPDSRLRVAGLTPDDVRDLDFVCRHADVVALSFVRDAKDVRRLQQELRLRRAEHLGVVLKIETRQGFGQLPEILLAAMRSRAIGVMIARGDLAVESGWERLAELQEEILWLCEAAHVPVIWATQVLENLNKTGLPSRAEITDAAMSERAECVMLNKGPYVLRAVGVLDDILRRMQTHQEKKRALLRPLHVAAAADDSAPGELQEPS